MQEDKYHKYLEELKVLIKSYYGALAVVTVEEKPLLTAHTQSLKNALRPGLEVLNWNSLSIPSFIKKCNQVWSHTHTHTHPPQKKSYSRH
jgi:dynein heavy chain